MKKLVIILSVYGSSANDYKWRLYVKKTEEVWMVNAIDTEQMINVSVAEPALPPIRPRETEVF